MRFSPRSLSTGSIILLSLGLPILAAAQPGALTVRFIDSATGYAVRPETVLVRGDRQELPAQAWNGLVQNSGRLSLALLPGRHHFEIGSAQHQPMSGMFELD